MPRKRHIVVTGIGLISPVGIGTEPTWQALLRGESGIAPITLFDAGGYPSTFAGEVKGFVPEDFVDRKDVKKRTHYIPARFLTKETETRCRSNSRTSGLIAITSFSVVASARPSGPGERTGRRESLLSGKEKTLSCG